MRKLPHERASNVAFRAMPNPRGWAVGFIVDRAEWRRWRRERSLMHQRERRARMRRIDYQDVSDEAAAIIDSECGSFPGGDYSSVLNRIVTEWAEFSDGVPE